MRTRRRGARVTAPSTRDASLGDRGSDCSVCALFFASCIGMFSCAGTPRVHSELLQDMPESLKVDYRTFTENCSKCHTLDRPLQAHVSHVQHWDTYVARMMATPGSGISEDESVSVLRFLYWYTERKQAAKAERSEGRSRGPDATEAPTAPSPGASPTAVADASVDETESAPAP